MSAGLSREVASKLGGDSVNRWGRDNQGVKVSPFAASGVGRPQRNADHYREVIVPA